MTSKIIQWRRYQQQQLHQQNRHDQQWEQSQQQHQFYYKFLYSVPWHQLGGEVVIMKMMLFFVWSLQVILGLMLRHIRLATYILTDTRDDWLSVNLNDDLNIYGPDHTENIKKNVNNVRVGSIVSSMTWLFSA